MVKVELPTGVAVAVAVGTGVEVAVGVAVAYDAFFAEKTIRIISEKNGTQSLSVFAKFIKDISINVPVLYGIFSIGLALVLGVGAAIVRKIVSDIIYKGKQTSKN